MVSAFWAPYTAQLRCWCRLTERPPRRFLGRDHGCSRSSLRSQRIEVGINRTILAKFVDVTNSAFGCSAKQLQAKHRPALQREGILREQGQLNPDRTQPGGLPIFYSVKGVTALIAVLRKTLIEELHGHSFSRLRTGAGSEWGTTGKGRLVSGLIPPSSTTPASPSSVDELSGLACGTIFPWRRSSFC
jgi:hypothetical protein